MSLDEVGYVVGAKVRCHRGAFDGLSGTIKHVSELTGEITVHCTSDPTWDLFTTYADRFTIIHETSKQPETGKEDFEVWR